MKRILLINPWIHDFSAYDLWLKPLGLLYLASFLQQQGFAIDLLDCLDRFHPLLSEQGCTSRNRSFGTGKFCEEEIEKPRVIADIPRRFKRFGIPYHLVEGYLSSLEDVGVVLVTSSMTYWYPGVREVIRLARRLFPDATIVLGGTYASLMRTHAEAESGADVVIPGSDFSPVLGHVGATCPPFETAAFFNEIAPAYHLYDSLPHAALITSLGCPFRCSYCASNRVAPVYLRLSHERIMANIVEYAVRYGVVDMALYDDALLWDAPAHFLPLFEQVIRKHLRIRFHTPNGLHARFITPEVARVLRLSGFTTIRIGLESSHQRFQQETGMKVTNEDAMAAVRNLKREGFSPGEIGMYVMAGRPDETVADVMDTLSFVEQLGVLAFVSEFSPVPGSQDWAREGEAVRQDPLWQNNSIAFLKHGWSLADMQCIKDEKHRINQAITRR